MGKREKNKNSIITLHNYVLDDMDIVPIESYLLDQFRDLDFSQIGFTFKNLENENKPKYYKIHEDGKFAYCEKCSNRVNRVYERKRHSGRFVGIGWNCIRCKTIFYD